MIEFCVHSRSAYSWFICIFPISTYKWNTEVDLTPLYKQEEYLSHKSKTEIDRFSLFSTLNMHSQPTCIPNHAI